jgi:hypothetical protein
VSYNDGVDVLGVGVGDFLPYLNIISSVAGIAGGAGGAGGLMGGKKDAAQTTPAASGASAAQQIQQALEQERQRQAFAKMQTDAANNRMLLFGALGLGGLGIFALLITRR